MDVFDFVEADESGLLDVGDGHSIYYEVSGNPKGMPVVRLHGGPGANSKPKNKQVFDPDKFRIVLFDQRGCGNSKPKGSIKNNTTQHLMADMEKLREHLGIEKWAVTGGSWGSTLALLYAQAHPERVLALGIYGIFLAEKKAVNWLYGAEGAGRFFPDAYVDFVAGFDEDERTDMFKAYAKRVLDTDSETFAKQAAVQFSTYVGKLCGMEENQLVEQRKYDEARLTVTDAEKAESQAGFEEFAWVHSRLEMHYERENFFIDEGQILANMEAIKHIPLYICHGRYDMVCPAEGAYRLYRAHPNSQLTLVPTAGHSSSEMKDELLDMFNNKLINHKV